MTTSTNPDRLAALHALCREDFAEGQRERAAARLAPSLAAEHLAAEPTDLEVAVGVAQLLLDSDNTHALRESLRLLLRALDSEPLTEEEAARRFVDRHFPEVASFLAAERGEAL